MKKAPQIVNGVTELSHALGIDAPSKEGVRKKFARLSRKYNFPVHHNGKRVYMLSEDIETINNQYLLGTAQIAAYLGIKRRTLHTWLKKGPRKIPIDKKRKLAFKSELDLWYTTWLFNRAKRRQIDPCRLLKNAPVSNAVISILMTLQFARLSHPRELRCYVVHSKDKILN